MLIYNYNQIYKLVLKQMGNSKPFKPNSGVNHQIQEFHFKKQQPDLMKCSHPKMRNAIFDQSILDKQAIQSIQKWTNLQKLKFLYCCRKKETNLVNDTINLNELCFLEVLEIKDTGIGYFPDVNYADIVSRIKLGHHFRKTSWAALQELSLSIAPLEDKDRDLLHLTSCKMPRLSKLSIYFGRESNLRIKYLELSNWPQLRQLCLLGVFVNKKIKAFRNLVDSYWPNLRILKLSLNKVLQQEALQIMKGMWSLQNLVIVDLSGVKIQERKVKKLRDKFQFINYSYHRYGSRQTVFYI